MQYDDTTPMSDIVAGMQVADAGAAKAFIARQTDTNVAALRETLAPLKKAVADEWMSRPQDIAAFSWPEHNRPIPVELLQAGLDAAVEGQYEQLPGLLAGQSFCDLMTFSSLLNFLQDSARHTWTGTNPA